MYIYGTHILEGEVDKSFCSNKTWDLLQDVVGPLLNNA